VALQARAGSFTAAQNSLKRCFRFVTSDMYRPNIRFRIGRIYAESQKNQLKVSQIADGIANLYRSSVLNWFIQITCNIGLQVALKFGTLFCTPYNFIKYWPFSNFFQCQNQDEICNNTVTKDSTTSQMRRYTTLWNISVLKATTENKTTSETTHF